VLKFGIGFGVLLSVTLILSFWVPTAVAIDIENMVGNPDFEADTAGWTIGAPNSFLIDKKEKFPVGSVAKATIDQVGPDAWVPEIHSPSFVVKNGEMYTVTFWAKTEPGGTRPLGVKYEQLDTWVGPATTFTLDDQMTEYQYSPTMTMGSPPAVVIHIQFNNILDDVWFAHFRVYKGKYVKDDIDLGQKPKAVTPGAKLASSWGEIKSR